MGSFNETCALSHLNISPGDKVRVLFLTQNPYVDSDQQFARRGCYHYDQWFVRTPPLKGEYDDYGRAALKASPINDLVAEVFDKDCVEQPFGFNQCHALPVVRGRGLDHYFEAAWEGRLAVQDEYTRPRNTPKGWPTWKKVHDLLRAAGLPIHFEVCNAPDPDAEDKGDNRHGYNAQDVRPGLVAVTFVTFGKEIEQLRAAEKVIRKVYDCKLTYRIPDSKYEPCMLVMPKGALADPTLMVDVAEVKAAIRSFPSGRNYRPLPVLYVMVREDVWKAYTTMKITEPSWRDSKPITVANTFEKLKAHSKPREKNDNPDLEAALFDMESYNLKDVLHSIPFQTMTAKHIAVAKYKDGFPMDNLLTAVAELAQVEYLMAMRHQSWAIPSLGGQEGHWDIQTKLQRKITKIAEKEWKKEREYR